jgi:hypothetical protein
MTGGQNEPAGHFAYFKRNDDLGMTKFPSETGISRLFYLDAAYLHNRG